MHPRRTLLGLVLTGLLGCAPVAQDVVVGARPAEPAQSAPKTIVVGVLAGTPTFAPWDSSNPSSGGPALTELHVSGLVTNDPVGGLDRRLARSIPTLESGRIVLLPDGRMRMVWPLRNDVKWHGGTPFTSDDLLFSWEVLSNEATPSTSGRKWGQLIDSVTADDPQTLSVTWKTTYYAAADFSERVLWPLPRHLLGETLRRDPEAFRNSPYWTTDYVHLGPFRLSHFGIDSLTFDRFDDYFLGRPKVDRIAVRVGRGWERHRGVHERRRHRRRG
ncbi:MAG: hypothetical protein HW416_2144 [Chloroflexi bacterium]|nr:hypothetical protein [Chloroflexota bacterium]